MQLNDTYKNSNNILDFIKKFINYDRDGDFIPDEVEDTLKEVKRRGKNARTRKGAKKPMRGS